MAEQSGGRRVTWEVGAELIRLMMPDVDLELVQLLLSRIARSAEDGHADGEGRLVVDSKPQAALLEEYAELLALIRDTGIDRSQLGAMLGLNPEASPIGDENPGRSGSADK